MYELRKFRSGDIQACLNDLRPYDRKIVDFFGIERIEEQHIGSLSYTLVRNQTVLAAAGVHIYWPGVAEVWMFATNEFTEHPFTTVKLMRKMFDHIQSKEHIWRFQTTIAAGLQPNNNFVLWLGFKAEGLLEKFGPWKDNYIMYAKVI